MKKLVFILALIGFPLSSFCQVTILQGTYRTFDGRSIDTYIIEGAKTVVYIEETSITEDQLADLETIKDIVDNIDFYYDYYTEFFGTEPAGGDPNFSYKSPVAFVPPSCGAACGLVGSKGIEVSPGMFCQIFNERKYQIGTNRIGIVGYEFGRNFFVDGSKMLLPYSNPEDRNGGFAEGFAGFPAILAHKAYCETQEPSYSMFQETLLYYKRVLDSFRAYTNDLSSSPYKQLAQETYIHDINRNAENFTGVFGFPIIVGTYETFIDIIDFGVYFNSLRSRNNVVTVEDALGNIAYSFSRAVNMNLNYYFKNVLKFSYDIQTESEINALPPCQDKLIRDKSMLWFTSIFDTINLNIRSVNYGKDQNTYYELLADKKLISRTTHGNNILAYSDLGGKDSLTLDINLISNNVIIDNQKILLRKRDEINMADLRGETHFSSPKGHTRRDYQSGVFVIDNFTKYEDWSYFEYYYPIVRNQIIYIEAEISNTKHYSPDNIDYYNNDNIIDYYSRVSLGGSGTPRVGQEVGTDDDDFYKVDFTMPTNLYFSGDWSDDMLFVIEKIYFETVGVSTGRYKNVIIRNITDTDNDGVIDFKDKCPTEYGEYEGCPDLQTSVPETRECEINIYPNPAGSIINIQACDEGELVIFDLMGNPLIKYEINDSNTQIDISKFSQGTYSVILTSKNRVQTTRFIKL